jgi:hypothetical protein
MKSWSASLSIAMLITFSGTQKVCRGSKTDERDVIAIARRNREHPQTAFSQISRSTWAGLGTRKQHTAFGSPHNCFPIRQKRNRLHKTTDTKPTIHTAADFVGDVWTFKWQCFVSTRPQGLEAKALHDPSPSLYLYRLLHLHEKSLVKGTTIPGLALRVPEGWGSQISWRSGIKGDLVVSPTHRPSLSPRNIPGTHFC